MKYKNIILISSFFVILSILVAQFLPRTLAKYLSEISSSAKKSIAYYVIDSSLDTYPINMDRIVPSDESYIYYFSISNNDGTNRLETSAVYSLSIRTTTNLPLSYKLYKNEDYIDENSEDIFIEKKVVTDKFGTYFNIFKTEDSYFGYTEDQTNEYALVIDFPLMYNNYNYQDLFESIEIIIDSKQVINKN